MKIKTKDEIQGTKSNYLKNSIIILQCVITILEIAYLVSNINQKANDDTTHPM